ncbi:hypothetical protein GCM10028818_24920 [Spirosoma horti]
MRFGSEKFSYEINHRIVNNWSSMVYSTGQQEWSLLTDQPTFFYKFSALQRDYNLRGSWIATPYPKEVVF